MANERITENIVRNLLRKKGYYENDDMLIEEQSSTNPKIDKLLKNASKTGKGKGRPEFILSFKSNPNDIIVIECKAQTTQHESKDRKQYKDHAVDGVLLYAAYLKDGFNVTAIAVSGQNDKEKKISAFLWLKNHYTYKPIASTLLTPDELSSAIKKASKPITEETLVKKAIAYNAFLNEHGIPEEERCTLISAILIALQDEPFLNSYQSYSLNTNLMANLIQACSRVLQRNGLDEEKTDVLIGEYSGLKNNVVFKAPTIANKKTNKDEKNTLLRDFVTRINDEILPYIKESAFDVLGKFYTQFIRYAGSDKKTGLVLTPTHITNFFCKVANLDEHDIVFDECCGTAGFLVAAMNYMVEQAGNDSEKKKAIKSAQLLGIEQRADMFSHACSNMMMRGDGKSHILHGDCFDEKNKNWIKARKPTKAFLNPPYKDGADEQLRFVENALACLVKNGIAVAICQMSTVVSSNQKVIAARERLLQHHTLEAVFSMPTDLFYPIGVNTSILVFKAHNKHPKGKKTFFGYFKEDGFVKKKHKGRVDAHGKWAAIERKWLNAYMNKESIVGLSVMQEVTEKDEWCAEAYMETDYSTLTAENFINNLHAISSFMFSTGSLEQATKNPYQSTTVCLSDRKWAYFSYKQVFTICDGFYNKKPIATTKGSIPFIGATFSNNGVTSYHDIEDIEAATKTGKGKNHSLANKIFKGEKYITISNDGSVGCAFYQPKDFTCSHSVSPITPKDIKMSPYIAMFLCTIIGLEKFRWDYGRKWRPKRIPHSRIKLPMNQEGKPDWQFMEHYIKSLPYSKNLLVGKNPPTVP